MPPQDPNDKIAHLQKQIDDLSDKLDDRICTHYHDGLLASRLDVSDLIGSLQVVAAVPTTIPKDFYDQVQIYTNGATLRLYWYDWVNHAWHYVTATA